MQETKRIDGNTVAVNCTGGCGESFRLPLTVEQEKSWRDGALIQNIAPQIPPDDRELLISGTCGECWDALFANADEDMGFLMRCLLLVLALPLAGQSVDSGTLCAPLGACRKPASGSFLGESSNGLAGDASHGGGIPLSAGKRVTICSINGLRHKRPCEIAASPSTGDDHRQSLLLSQIALAGSAVLDVQSSWGLQEKNVLLGTGTFGGRQAAVSLGMTGGLILVETLVVRKWPSTAGAFRIANWLGAAAAGWNWRQR